MRPTYALSYDITTPESAEAGDIAEFGFQREPVELGREFGLAAAIREARAEGCTETSDIERADYSRGRISLYSGSEQNYRTGAERRVCAHFSNMTPSTLRRIVRAVVGKRTPANLR